MHMSSIVWHCSLFVSPLRTSYVSCHTIVACMLTTPSRLSGWRLSPSGARPDRTLNLDSRLPLPLAFEESHCNQSCFYWPERFHGGRSRNSCVNIDILQDCQWDFCRLSKCGWASFRTDQMHSSLQSSSLVQIPPQTASVLNGKASDCKLRYYTGRKEMHISLPWAASSKVGQLGSQSPPQDEDVFALPISWCWPWRETKSYCDEPPRTIRIDLSSHCDDNCQQHMSRYDTVVRPILSRVRRQDPSASSSKCLAPR